MKKFINKLMTIVLMTAMALNLAFIPAGAETSVSYTYNSNGGVATSISYDNNGKATAYGYYDAQSRLSYTKDSTNATVTSLRTYSTATGNLQSVSYTQSVSVTNADGTVSNQTHVYTQFYMTDGTTIAVDNGTSASLTSDGVSGGSNASATFAHVELDYNNIKAGTGGWSSKYTISSLSISGAVLYSLSNTSIDLLCGGSNHHKMGHTDNETITPDSVSILRSTARSNTNQTFTFSYGSNGFLSSYSYFNGSTSEQHNSCTLSNYDPVVTGTIQSVTSKVGADGKTHYYVSVSADKIDMFDGNGQQSADGETILVEVDAATASALQNQVGSEITVSGNVTSSVDGHLTMTMNEGGYTTGSAGTTYSSWRSSNASFYNSMVSTMRTVYQSLGVTNSSWQNKWSALQGQAQANF